MLKHQQAPVRHEPPYHASFDVVCCDWFSGIVSNARVRTQTNSGLVQLGTSALLPSRGGNGTTPASFSGAPLIPREGNDLSPEREFIIVQPLDRLYTSISKTPEQSGVCARWVQRERQLAEPKVAAVKERSVGCGGKNSRLKAAGAGRKIRLSCDGARLWKPTSIALALSPYFSS